MQQQAFLALADGRIFHGNVFGAQGTVSGEVCFNTSMTGYQEILTDPSYTDQIITFTCPHIGNVGINKNDMESDTAAARGLIVRQATRSTSNYRSEQSLQHWLEEQNVVGISGIDTRALTRHLRVNGSLNGVLCSDNSLTESEAINQAKQWHGLQGRDLVGQISIKKLRPWTQGSYQLDANAFYSSKATRHVVAFDFGCKHNILRKLADRNCRVTLIPASSSAEMVLQLQPDGIFLSNGPGDPSAVPYAVKEIRKLLDHNVPMFGICMGHQLLSQALGLATFKLKFGHRGGNHPVASVSTEKDSAPARVEITSQNHGFSVADTPMVDGVDITHRSLFDNTIEGLRLRSSAIFSVQYHPEASPGPHDSDYLFDRFVALMG
ncbi:MAG: glutamine-hydrolyzing carbamoyl-phosphate synthase small subunit [Mariprofundales bacterium]